METQLTPNTSIEPEDPKVSKFTIILLILIGISALILGYLVYNSNAESKSINTSTNSATVSNTVPTPNKTGSDTAPASASITSTPSTATAYTLAQVAENNSKSSCWTIIDGNVYDITKYVPNHPGGEEQILKICGKDGTALFAKPMEHKEGDASGVLTEFQIGILTK
jgi:cytochrome b involved in lipid metabolism